MDKNTDSDIPPPLFDDSENLKRNDDEIDLMESEIHVSLESCDLYTSINIVFLYL